MRWGRGGRERERDKTHTEPLFQSIRSLKLFSVKTLSESSSFVLGAAPYYLMSDIVLFFKYDHHIWKGLK